MQKPRGGHLTRITLWPDGESFYSGLENEGSCPCEKNLGKKGELVKGERRGRGEDDGGGGQ